LLFCTVGTMWAEFSLAKKKGKQSEQNFVLIYGLD
jgi:hypothetical protein